MKIIVDEAIPFVRGVFEPFARVEYMPGVDIDRDAVGDADALMIRTRTRCDERLLSKSSVKMIATATIGFDHIDMGYCAGQGIRVATAAGCNARGVLQYICTVLAMLSERYGFRPEDKCVGVVGVGHVGSLVAEYASMLGFRVLCCDPPRQAAEGQDGFVPLERIAAEADIITLHTPLNRDGEYKTLDMIDREFLGKVRHGAVIINTARGPVVDEGALLEAMSRGMVAGCVIDTWRGEPRINHALLEKAIFATPHIAGYSLQGKAMGTAMAVRALAGEFGLPLDGWYPPGVSVSIPRRITWDGLKTEAKKYFDIEALSDELKRNAQHFDNMRNTYDYRTEYF